MYIDAIMWYFNLNKQQAQQYYKNCIANNELNTLEEILKAYKQTAQQAFYTD